MKKNLFSIVSFCMGVVLFTSCNEDNEAVVVEVPVSNGAYIVSSGNMSASINGSLTYFDYATQSAVQNAFAAANGQSLGVTANDAMRYGNKFYIVVDNEHTIFVTDAKTLKIIKKISTTALMGEADGAHPRCITAYENNIYVSTYGGYVAAIDTVNFNLTKKYQAGSYPEGVLVSNGYLFVANSDYGYGNASISQINLSTGVDNPITHANIRNPQQLAISGTDLYYLDYGQYGPAPTYAQEHAGVYCITGSTINLVVPDATGWGCGGTRIYTFNSPYGGNSTSYSYYDVSNHTLTDFVPEGIESPAAIAMDPVSGDVFIASYHMTTSEWGTWADYYSNGYVNVYNNSVTSLKKSFDCGVCPTRITFNISSTFEEY